MSGIGEDGRSVDEKVEVTVRTPAGASAEFKFRLAELTIEATSRAIEHFVAKRELEAGDYGLELIRGGGATPMLDTNELRDYGLRDGDVLHLIPEKPQVDG